MEDGVKQPQNIQCFNAVCRALFNLLYGHFPYPCTVDSAELMNDLPDYCTREYGDSPDADNYVAATIRFLAAEGFLRHSGTGEEGETFFPNLVLTSKGFTVLNRPLEGLKAPDLTIGQRLRENLSLGDLASLVATVFQWGAK